MAERNHFPAEQTGEGLGHQQRHAKLTRQPLEPRRQIYRRPDDGEVEAPAAADIAIADR